MIKRHCRDSYEVSSLLTRILIVLAVAMVSMFILAVMVA